MFQRRHSRGKLNGTHKFPPEKGDRQRQTKWFTALAPCANKLYHTEVRPRNFHAHIGCGLPPTQQQATQRQAMTVLNHVCMHRAGGPVGLYMERERKGCGRSASALALTRLWGVGGSFFLLTKLVDADMSDRNVCSV